MILGDLVTAGLAHPPSWLTDNAQYVTIMGSEAYGVSCGSSDFDLYGWCIPPKDLVFPHLAGEVPGFGRQVKRFEQWQEHHMILPQDMKIGPKGRQYDVQIYSIVKYFDLLMENNPNMIDSIFTPMNCVLHSSRLGEMVREKRHMFLHKGCWHKFKGYAYSQVHKMKTKEPDPASPRATSIAKYGYDVKFAYHVVRLLNEVEQILTERDIDLQRNNEQLKSIRRGDWKLEEIENYFKIKEVELESAYTASKLPWGPDEGKIKELLLHILEEHYGRLGSDAIVRLDVKDSALRSIRDIIDLALKG